MLPIIKTALLSGLILTVTGYLLPDKLSVGGVFVISFFIGGAIFITMRNKESQSRVKILPLIFVVLLTSAWASLCLIGVCNIFSGFFSCSINKIRALVFMNFASPMLLAIALWFQQFFNRK